MENVIRTEDKVDGEVHVRYIFGLDIFAVNKVRKDRFLELEFLQSVGRKATMSAHTGMLLDFADTPLELFGEPKENTYYEEVNIGVSNDSFYRRDEWPYFPPCFFPKVTGSFWNIIQPATGETWGKILYSDALGFYVDPIEPDYVSRINRLFENYSESINNWKREVLEIYRLIIVSAGDMNYFEVYAKNPEDFDILSLSIQEVENIVLADSWYQENKDNLIWDGERGMCLRLAN